ncbi:hypothetical protein, partial [Mycolicibacterium pulveris]|uniref:hypothetical protein n=1 Tax=Mycolicibacterium pulveris TaxID=36813 RepID=UPI0021F2B37A
KHAASVRPEPGSNSPNKNRPEKTSGKTKTTPLNGKKECSKKQQQTKTTKHTIEFSNNTPAVQATLPLYSTWTETSNHVRQPIWLGPLASQ